MGPFPGEEPVLVDVGQVEEQQEAELSLASSCLHMLAIREEGEALRAPAADVGQPMLQDLSHRRELWGGSDWERATEHMRAGHEHLPICYRKSTTRGSKGTRRMKANQNSLLLHAAFSQPGETKGYMDMFFHSFI